MENRLYLTFGIKNETFGISIDYVAEILTYSQITELPNTKPWIKGVVNLRGEVAPIIDMRLKFDQNRTNLPYNDETIIIAVKTSDSRVVGIIVDFVSDVENISDDQIVEAPEIGVSLDAKYLKGLFEKEGKSVILLDVDNILAKEEMAKAITLADDFSKPKTEQQSVE